MDSFNNFMHSDTAHRILTVILFLLTLAVIYVIYKFVLNKVREKVSKTATMIDDFVIDLMRIPTLWLLFWITFRIFTEHSFLYNTSFYGTLSRINNLLLIFTVGWIMIKIVRIIFYYFEQKLQIKEKSVKSARGNLTKMKIFEGIIVAILTVFFISIALMTFERVRTIGVSLLTSAGIAGIIVGLAAQKSIGAVLAGIQIALTQPISLDDQVLVEGENGFIEEITLTYVVVRVWNGKRLILPVNYFLENPFQNWSRNTTSVLNTLFLYLDYNIPVDELRKQLNILIETHPKWDKRTAIIQVTDSTKEHIELRILLSSVDPSAGFDLQVDIREKMIGFINKNYPGCFPKVRTMELPYDAQCLVEEKNNSPGNENTR